MAEVLERLKGQDLAEQQVVPMILWPLDPLPSDADSPFVLQPLRGDENGNLAISLSGPMGSILLPDDADGVPVSAIADRVPTVARLYVFDDDAGEFNRARAGDDTLIDAGTLGPNILAVETRPRIFQANNGAFIRVRANENFSAFTSLARTATSSTATFSNGNFRGGSFIIDVTAITATPSVVFSIEGFDALSGKFYSLLDSVAIVGVGTTVITVYPGLTPVANIDASALLPWQWRVTATHADADSITYSVGANLMM